MSRAAQLKDFVGFLRDIPDFIRNPISIDRATAAVTERLANRDAAFVRFVNTTLLMAPQSPYPRLFELAGCAPGDLAAMVRDRGVEQTLMALRAAGVYVSFEEFKGRKTLVRGGGEIPISPSAFANPSLTRAFATTTSGSSGVPRMAHTTLDHLATQSEHRIIALAAHGLIDAPSAIWRPILPAASGLNNVLRLARFGRPPLKWFAPVANDSTRPPLAYRLATAAALAMGRWAGARLPFPEAVPFSEAIRIARWMARQRDACGRVWLNTTVSGGVRVAGAAQEHGIDLSGAVFMVAGEPATAAKVQRIRASGADYFTDYGMTEIGRIAIGCARPAREGDLHLLTDVVALIPCTRLVGKSDRPVSSLHVTSFSPQSPTLLLNVEFDDEGILDVEPCGCPLETLGLRTHLRDVRSYGRLTSEGVTVTGAELIRIIEEVLPARCGGSPLDYQFAEEEDASGFTRLTLIASPHVTVSDEALRDEVLMALSRAGGATALARGFWQQAGTLRVRRSAPFVSERGKQPSFRNALPGRVGTHS